LIALSACLWLSSRSPVWRKTLNAQGCRTPEERVWVSHGRKTTGSFESGAFDTDRRLKAESSL
jgi:hypothetical protein